MQRFSLKYTPLHGLAWNIPPYELVLYMTNNDLSDSSQTRFSKTILTCASVHRNFLRMITFIISVPPNGPHPWASCLRFSIAIQKSDPPVTTKSVAWCTPKISRKVHFLPQKWVKNGFFFCKGDWVQTVQFWQYCNPPKKNNNKILAMGLVLTNQKRVLSEAKPLGPFPVKWF